MSDALSLASKIQAEGADPERWAVVFAHAGSGKTKVLVDRVARLLLRREGARPGAAPDTILCITYTKAAANEMLSRLFTQLGSWSVKSDDELRRILQKLEGRETRAYSNEDLRDARSLFARALETPGGLRIETIHAFCGRVLQRFPLEADVLPGFQQIEDVDSFALWTQARARAVRLANAEHREMLDTLALAGGHDGAEAALNLLFRQRPRVKAFIDRMGNDPARIAAHLRSRFNTPDERAEDYIAFQMGEAMPLDDIREAISILTQGTANDVQAGEFLEFAISSAPAPERFAAYASLALTEKQQLRARSLVTAPTAKKAPFLLDLFDTAAPQGREVLRILKIQREWAALKACEAMEALFTVGLPALEHYAALKRQRAALDFEDLIDATRALLTRKGVSDWVLYKLDGGLNHLLLDEAQDTSPPQWDLIDALTAEFSAGIGAERATDPRTVFIVGDEKQSIYSFQGAEPARLRLQSQKIQAQVSSTHSKVLATSFRSSPEILSFVDSVWNEAPSIPGAELSQTPGAGDDTLTHLPMRAAQAGLVELWPITEPASEANDDEVWQRPLDVVLESSPVAQLAGKVANEIDAMLKRGESVWDEANGVPVRRAMRAEDILILLRARTRGLFDGIINALKAKGLPVAGADRLTLTDHIGVQDCLNLMRFALSPARDLVLAEILRGPFCGLVDDDRFLFELAHNRKPSEETLWHRVCISILPEVVVLQPFLQGLIAHQHLPPFEFLSRVLDTPEVCGHTGWYRLNARLGRPARDPIESLLQRALHFDDGKPASMQVFVSELENQSVELKRDLDAPSGEIRVMTVHGAKGLESRVVILPDTTAPNRADSDRLFELGDDLIWAPNELNKMDALADAQKLRTVRLEEERRRLLYVALTRARDRLIIAGHWSGPRPKNRAAETSDTKKKPKEEKILTGYGASSWYSLCLNGMQALGVAPDNDGIHRLGVTAPLTPSELTAAAPLFALPDFFQRAAPVEQNTQRFVAPSHLLAPLTPVTHAFGRNRSLSLRRGRLIHTLLQHLPEISPQERLRAAEIFLAGEGDLPLAFRTDVIATALGVLKDPAFADLFAKGSRAEAAIVGTSPRLPPGTIINGRIDRLVMSQERVRIVDFKTDQPPPEHARDVAPDYIAQMAAYAAVLETAWPGRTVEAWLCWTQGPRLMQLPQALLTQALAQATQTPL